MTTLNELTAYWKAMPTHVPAIKMVTVGRDDEALNNQTAPGLVNYPHLRVDTPTVVLGNDTESPTADFTYQIFLFAPVSGDNPDDENTMLSTMLTTLQAVYTRLWTDADAELFDLVLPNAEGEPIREWSGDNCFGWTLKIKIRLYTATC